MRIFVGNLPFTATEVDVKGLFEVYGEVSLVTIRKRSGLNSRGFGFVTMTNDNEGLLAISSLNGSTLMGRPLEVTVERPKVIKPKKINPKLKEIVNTLDVEIKTDFVAPIIPEKKNKKVYVRKSKNQVWQKRKGRGTAKPWKKKPGGVNKKFKYAK